MEGVGNLAFILEYVDPARGRHFCRELRFAPADVQWRYDVIEQVGGGAAGIIPVFAEAEEAVGIIGALRSRSQPGFPVNEIVALAIRSGFFLDWPVPLTLDRIPVIRALAHDHLADHAVGDRLAGLPPLIGGRGLR